MKKFFTWIFVSSQNADAISMKVKGVLLAIVPTVIYLAGLSNITLSTEEMTAFVNGLALLIQFIGGGIALAITLAGMIRAMIASASNKNAGMIALSARENQG